MRELETVWEQGCPQAWRPIGTVWRVRDLARRAFRKRFLQLRENTGGRRMSNELTYMDCWHFIAPLIPVDTDYTMDIYIMTFNALKEAEKKRIAKKKGGAENG
jgi:hypothetical protein